MSHRFPDPVGCGAVLQAAHKFTLQDAWSFGSVSTRIFAAGTAENVTLDAFVTFTGPLCSRCDFAGER